MPVLRLHRLALDRAGPRGPPAGCLLAARPEGDAIATLGATGTALCTPAPTLGTFGSGDTISAHHVPIGGNILAPTISPGGTPNTVPPGLFRRFELNRSRRGCPVTVATRPCYRHQTVSRGGDSGPFRQEKKPLRSGRRAPYEPGFEIRRSRRLTRTQEQLIHSGAGNRAPPRLSHIHGARADQEKRS